MKVLDLIGWAGPASHTRDVATKLDRRARDLQGQGHARRLLAEAERRIEARGLRTARLAVEPDDERVRRLYEHVG